MTRIQWDCIVWLAIALQGFLWFELLPVFWTECPWTTLSNFVWLDIKWWKPVAAIVAVFLIVLLGHFDEHWRARYLIEVAVIGAAAIAVHIAASAIDR